MKFSVALVLGVSACSGTTAEIGLDRAARDAGGYIGHDFDGALDAATSGDVDSGLSSDAVADVSSGDAAPYVDSAFPCTPKTCAALGVECGTINDGCGNAALQCGPCVAPNTCGGGGRGPQQCGCTPVAPPSCRLQIDCGNSHPDGCGHNYDCGQCGGYGYCESSLCDGFSNHGCVQGPSAPMCVKLVRPATPTGATITYGCPTSFAPPTDLCAFDAASSCWICKPCPTC